ncbi:MAG: ABC transporter ATP-binding protein [Syntrophorhabdaceae bacterium]|nr:ABC transporter ATP-binding protein [Syntrophorhabdaceae bacterium]
MVKDRPILEAKNLRIDRMGVTTLDIPSFKVGEGEILSIIGPNGAGKSTLLMAMCHLFRQFSGIISFKGKEVGRDISPSEYRRHIGLVFQEPLLFNTSVFENVASGLKFRRIDKRNIEKIVMGNLERFGLAPLRNRPARTLSGGEAQRVSLARAFAINPDILFLDEPFSSLDAPTKDNLIYDLEKVIKDSKVTTIFATHERDEALRLSERIVVINNGRMVQDGAPEEVMNYPCNEFVASFMGVETILSGVVLKEEGGILTVSVSGLNIEAVGEAPIDSKVILCIKPEGVFLYPVSIEAQSSARNNFMGEVTRIVSSGFYQKVYLNCGFPLVAYITNASAKSLGVKEGINIRASFKATSIHVIKV